MSTMNAELRTIYCLDNIDVLYGINNECIDLVYLDPPFNKKKKFTAPIGSVAEGAEFSDIFREEDIKDEWVKTIEFDNYQLHQFLNGVKTFSNKYNYCYLVYMSIRLIEIKRILKPTGSVYLHCDPTMSHHLKITLDCIFGESNFNNEIVWHYSSFHGRVQSYFPRKHDIIFFYRKQNNSKFNIQKDDKDMELLVDYKAWKKYLVNGDEIRGDNMPSGVRFKRNIDKFIKRHNRQPTKDDVVYRMQAQPIDDVWQVAYLDPKDKKERVGYPTQKPLALLERIIKASTNKGDVVLDPFCGCATTCIAAEKLERKWIGVDVSKESFRVVKKRLRDEVPVDLFRGKPTFSEIPPIRSKDDDREQGYVYIVSNSSFPNYYKVGMSKEPEIRLNQFQTGDPHRKYSVEYKYKTPNYKELEKHIHSKFKSKHEWVNATLDDIKAAIIKYESD